MRECEEVTLHSTWLNKCLICGGSYHHLRYRGVVELTPSPVLESQLYHLTAMNMCMPAKLLQSSDSLQPYGL